jgi:hypothetical protein
MTIRPIAGFAAKLPDAVPNEIRTGVSAIKALRDQRAPRTRAWTSFRATLTSIEWSSRLSVDGQYPRR